jgi:hypothetical protein
MAEMVEVVALEIYRSMTRDMSESPILSPLYLNAARAAIEATRNPSRGMILSGYKALMDWDARTGDDYGIYEVWAAMVATALDEALAPPDIAPNDMLLIVGTRDEG